jgi:6-phosphogluconolactonase
MRLYLSAILAMLFFQVSNAQHNEYFLLTGTYTTGKSEGIYVFNYQLDKSLATPVYTATGIRNPSFLSLSPDGKKLYAVSEMNGDGNAGKVVSYDFNTTTGRLTKLNEQPSGGDDPCYVLVDHSNKWVFAGNYSSGSFSVLPIMADGSLGAAKTTINHSGSGADKSRQEKPHVHATVISPDNRFLFVPDLGIDKIMIYRFDVKDGSLKPAKQAFAATKPGAGPRHFSFHPNGKFAYIIEELSGSVTVFSFKAKSGELKPIQNIRSLPDGFTGTAGSADIHLSSDGRFLYASNRGESNTIVIYSVHAKDGKLSLLGHQSTLGKGPRNFSITPDGKQLIVANQGSDEMVIFNRNTETGMLTDSGKRISVPTPVCIQWGRK